MSLLAAFFGEDLIKIENESFYVHALDKNMITSALVVIFLVCKPCNVFGQEDSSISEVQISLLS